MKYTKSHEWIQLNGKVGTVGITEFAKNEIGDIVHIELPKAGHVIKAGEEVCVLESTKSATDIYSPVSGKITLINTALKSSPDPINRSPEKDGWLYQIELSQPKEIESLLTKAEYEQLVGE